MANCGRDGSTWNALTLRPPFSRLIWQRSLFPGGIIESCAREGELSLVVPVFGGVPDHEQIGPFAREIHVEWKSAIPSGALGRI
jgi:hypothetical protein